MPNTMAEAFCKKHLITRMENGEKHTSWKRTGREHTGWEDGDIYANMRGITQTDGVTLFQARAITLFQAIQKNGYYMTITVFRDRSWMVHEEPATEDPPTGEPIMVGTRENEHHILDLIHDELNSSLEGLAEEFEVDVSDVLAQAKQMSPQEPEPKPEPKPEPPEFPAHPDAPREQ